MCPILIKQIDMWSDPRMGAEMEIFVSPEKFGLLKSFLYRHGMGFSISDRNVAQYVVTGTLHIVTFYNKLLTLSDNIYTFTLNISDFKKETF